VLQWQWVLFLVMISEPWVRFKEKHVEIIAFLEHLRTHDQLIFGKWHLHDHTFLRISRAGARVAGSLASETV
jgi:hypothetical protein